MTDPTEEQLLSRWQIISSTGDDAEIEGFINEMDRMDAERERRLSAPEALAQAALWYVSQGVPVFRLQPRSKEPYPGSHGFKDATTDTEQVQKWWQQEPQANIGAPTGVIFDVIDIDGPPGFSSLADMRANGVQFRACSLQTAENKDDADTTWIYAVAYTPNRGGRHFFVKPTGRGSTAKLAEGIDYKGTGGYVVMPPSRWANGERYDWIHTPQLDQLRGDR